MKRIDVVGGVYRERCSFPYWDQIYGSAGRASVALSDYASQVCLHTLLSSSELKDARAHFGSFNVELCASTRQSSIGFDYLHSLSVPTVSPPVDSIIQESALTVAGSLVIRFGMLECSPVVDAETCIYDPQSAYDPALFHANGSKARRLAVIANLAEAIKMTGEATEEGAASYLLKRGNAEVVVIKNGMHGASVLTKESKAAIPAYKAKSVFSIGSGDVFVAAFGLAWGINQLAPVKAATYASLATAAYVESRSLPMISPASIGQMTREVVALTGGNIYLAGPFRELGQRSLIDETRRRLSALGMKVFSPVHDIGHGTADVVVARDLEALRECDAVFAILNGSSPGTLFEVGYARAIGKPVYCVAQNVRAVDMKLPSGSGCVIHDDYVSALHQIAWR